MCRLKIHQTFKFFQVLLAANFFVHFGLNNTSVNEYDTDIMLEYDDVETYREFKDFFFDVLSEFEKFGKIIQFKVSFGNGILYNINPYGASVCILYVKFSRLVEIYI